MDLVRIESLWKKYNLSYVLKDISLNIKPGEIVGILGANGAGKSTLIYCLLGIISYERGNITFFEKFKMPKHRKKILSLINFASTYTALPYSLTVEESLTVFGHLYGIKDIKTKIHKTLELFSIENLIKIPLRKLSSGQIMRVNLSKSLLNDPKILLLDEPTAGLDPEIAEKTRQFLKKQCISNGISILYTSHNLNEIEEIADRIVIIKNGQIVVTGTKEDLFKNYNLSNLKELYFRAMSQ